MSDISERISKILEDPESIRMISEIASGLMSEGSADTEKDEETAVIPSVASGENPIAALSGLQSFFSRIAGKEDVENSIRLISALIPYLNDNRRSSAEYIIKILGLIKLFTNLGSADISKILGLLSK